MLNTRLDPRFDVDITVDYTTAGMFLSNRVMNLSRGGLFIQTDHPLPLNSEVFLTFRLPATETKIEMRGRVAWTFDMKKGTAHLVPGMGIRLVDAATQARQELEAYLTRLGDGEKLSAASS